MQMSYNAATTNISNVESSLANFYSLISRLSQSRFVRLTKKEDEADNILWTFTYRKKNFTLQYDIYNGISLFSEKATSQKIISKLANMLQIKSAS